MSKNWNPSLHLPDIIYKFFHSSEKLLINFLKDGSLFQGDLFYVFNHKLTVKLQTEILFYTEYNILKIPWGPHSSFLPLNKSMMSSFLSDFHWSQTGTSCSGTFILHSNSKSGIHGLKLWKRKLIREKLEKTNLKLL